MIRAPVAVLLFLFLTLLFSSFPISDFQPPETWSLGGQGAQEVTLLAPGPSAASSGAAGPHPKW